MPRWRLIVHVVRSTLPLPLEFQPSTANHGMVWSDRRPLRTVHTRHEPMLCDDSLGLCPKLPDQDSSKMDAKLRELVQDYCARLDADDAELTDI